MQLSENYDSDVTVTIVHWIFRRNWNWMMLHVVPNVDGGTIRLELKQECKLSKNMMVMNVHWIFAPQTRNVLALSTPN